MAVTRRSFLQRSGLCLAAIALTGWHGIRRLVPRRVLRAARPVTPPAATRPLCDNDLHNPGPWAG